MFWEDIGSRRQAKWLNDKLKHITSNLFRKEISILVPTSYLILLFKHNDLKLTSLPELFFNSDTQRTGNIRTEWDFLNASDLMITLKQTSLEIQH